MSIEVECGCPIVRQFPAKRCTHARKLSLPPPIFAQGVFVSPSGGEFYVHIYRRGCLPFSSNTKGIGAEGDFYGSDAIEQTLSDAETQFASLVRQLREGDCEPSNKPLIDRFVAHSLIRTKCFRAGVHNIGASVLREGFREFLDPEYTPQLLAKLVEDVMLEPEVRNFLAAAPTYVRPLLEELMRKMLLHPDMHGKLRQMIVPTLNTIDTATSVQAAQRQILENHQHLEKRVRDLSEITWHLETYKARSLILGDIGPLVRGSEPKEWGRIFHGIPQSIWFPLSDRILLVGDSPYGTTRPDFEEVNVVSAENSVEFFVASQRTQREDQYLQRISVRMDRITAGQLSELKQTIREYLTTPGGALTTE